MKVKVSIIIPVYNVEKYLYQCLNSATNQTLKDIEMIVVNDASTDASLSIIQDFCRKDNRFKLVNLQKNKGLGFARNEAIKYTKGEYVLYLDSDDWLESNTAELAYTKATQGQHQVVIFGYKNHFIYGWRKKKRMKKLLPSLYENDTNFFNHYLLARKGLHSMVWMYLFSKSFIIDNKILFPEDMYFEDINFTAKALYLTSKIGVIKDVTLYNYRTRRNSIVQSSSKKKINDFITAHIMLKEFLEKEQIFERYKEDYWARFLSHCVFFSFMDYFKLPKKKIDKELRDFMKNIRKSNLFNRNNLWLIKKVITKLEKEEKEEKKMLEAGFIFLSNIKYNYWITRLKIKILFLFRNLLLKNG